jgi:selenocysteine lyase/cysteine desulfurase
MTDSLSHVRSMFPGAAGYLNSATMGLPSAATLAAARQMLADWEAGRVDPNAYDVDVDRSRAAYAAIAGVEADDVAIVGAGSVAAGLVAASLADGASVLCAAEDFTSALFPFLVDTRLTVRTVPLDDLIDHVRPGVDLVAVSHVQSADGRVVDAERLATAAAKAGCRTFIDATQGAGWKPFTPDAFDVTVAAAYKWLCAPRGVAFMTVTPAAREWLVPRISGWYAGEDRWSSIYGPPLRLAASARRFDVSPAWLSFAGAVPALELLASLGAASIEAHNVGLANEFRARLDLKPSNSAIVSVPLAGAGERLAAAGIASAGRAGRTRLSFHVYNSRDDVDRAAAAILSSPS